MGWLSVALKVLPYIIGAVHGVESLHAAAAGPAKQQAAVDMINVMVGAVDAGATRDILSQPDVDKAVRAFIDAYVALQNIISRFKATATAAA